MPFTTTRPAASVTGSTYCHPTTRETSGPAAIMLLSSGTTGQYHLPWPKRCFKRSICSPSFLSPPLPPTSASQTVPLHPGPCHSELRGKGGLLVPFPHLEAVYLRQVTLPLWTPGSSSVNEKPDWHEQFSCSNPLRLTKPETEIAHVERERNSATVAESEREGQSPPQAFPSILHPGHQADSDS